MSVLATLSETSSTLISVLVLFSGGVGAVVAFSKIGPDRRTSMVEAQDTVIDNLREEVDRHRGDIRDLRDQLEVERRECDRKMADLNRQMTELRGRLPG